MFLNKYEILSYFPSNIILPLNFLIPKNWEDICSQLLQFYCPSIVLPAAATRWSNLGLGLWQANYWYLAKSELLNISCMVMKL